MEATAAAVPFTVTHSKHLQSMPRTIPYGKTAILIVLLVIRTINIKIYRNSSVDVQIARDTLTSMVKWGDVREGGVTVEGRERTKTKSLGNKRCGPCIIPLRKGYII